MNLKLSRLVLGLLAAIAPLFLMSCGGSGYGSTGFTSNPDGTVSMMVSDAPENDWATIGVKVLSISLNPLGGGTAVNVYTAPSTVPTINLVQLDQLGELLGNASVPVGTYTSATLTLSANPGDVLLTSSEDPDPGFAGAASTTIPSSQIQIQGATGNTGSKTVPLTVNFVSNLVVTANQNNQLDLEFDLSHPAFIVAHVPPAAAGQTIWAINFNGPWIHHHPIYNITRFLLRDLYGAVSSVSSDDTSITITKDFPVEPATNPETTVASAQNLSILADATNGTLFYNLDVSPVTPTTIMNFSSVATLLTSNTEFVRVAARYQAGGKLVAVRIWASSSFDKIFSNPEGHVLHVNTTTDILSVEKENGGHVALQVVDGANPTKFYFRTPASALSDATVIGSGTAFLSNVKRGFKVHVLANPLSVPPTAVTVDIEIARFDGKISNASSSPSGSFDYTRIFNTPSDNYTNFQLSYLSSSTPNGNDPLGGGAITGFKWWNFAFPTLVTSTVTDTSEAQAIIDFASATNGSVNFGGAIGALAAYGESGAIWGDPANAAGWSATQAILLPSPVPLGIVATSYSSGTGTFTMTAPPVGGVNAVTVDVNTTAGSATLLYQVNRAAAVVTISPENIGTATNLVTGTLVKIAGVPEANGHLKAYVILYYTGTTPAE